jgi:plastocyanin
VLGTAVLASDLKGSILIEKKLTRRSVTNAAGTYQRGVAVDLGGGSTTDPNDALAFERSDVAIYIEESASNLFTSDGIAGEIQQTHRQFEPDFLVVPAGSTVSFPNFDPIFHNVFSLSKTRTFDLGNYPMGQTRTVRFRRPGIVFVNCHLHPNMAASGVVCPTRWCTKSDESGRFQLAGLPPGKHTIVAWHKAAGFFRQTVTVKDGAAPEVRFVIPFRETISSVASR